ncbi:phosphoesterase [Chryseobacterium sp. MMS23-Vi53]|uniref:phosphoesterase n=1 Tax=Chryseobacterium sp. MMS23-Vi53 TaxID=3386644 RepID=UPI0039EA6994
MVFVAGHEPNLQYINDREIPIIVSGSANSGSKVKNGFNSKFSSNDEGFAKITSFTDGSVELAFYTSKNQFSTPLFETEIVAADAQPQTKEYNEKATPEYVYKSIYEPEELKHSKLYTSLWGAHYRKDYTTPIKVKTALLDTLYGGLEVLRKGGGHQTNSLRLKDSSGKEYTMRNVKKSSLRFIQYFLFKTQYLDPDLEDTYFLQLLQDYWTTANPYASLTVPEISEAIGIIHAKPELFYIPKQKALNGYNDDYGDKIYYIEEQISDGFGSHDKIIGTPDLVEKLERKDKISINESLYIRSRLLDNILGDFDRHSDQWRWAEDKSEDGTLMYSPIPRDRDQVYSDFDGPILSLIRTLAPPMRFMQRYDGNYKHIRWFNDAGDDLDRMVLRHDSEEDWVREAKYIKEHLSDDIVEKAFSKIPDGVDAKKKENVKKALIERIAGIEEHSRNLYHYLRSFVTITGTEKDDWFVITRFPNGITSVKGYRIKNGIKSTPFWDAEYDRKITKEIWIYGLDDQDVFEVTGDGKNLIPIKIIGGKNNDTYRIENCHRIHVYDQKSKPNTFETKVVKTLTDNYNVNNYDFMKGRRDMHAILPFIGYNPDDGVALGATFNYTKNDLVRNPFTALHSLSAFYYTATGGLNIQYSGEFAHVIQNLNLGINAGYTTPNYTNNFFGLGNNTLNDNDDMEYNRVRMRNRWISPLLIYKNYYGSRLQAAIKYENIELEETPGRFVNIAGVNPYLFNGQDFYSLKIGYSYSNFDASSSPKKGIGFGILTGYTANFSKDKGFAFVTPEFRLTTKINRKGTMVAATKLKANYIFNNNFEFYQAATLGGNEGLRGFRTERFSGKSSYYQTTDLRLSLGRFKNGILPLSFGIYGGFDYGRVWIDHEISNKWHTSQGGGLFLNIAGLTTANIAYFNSTDGGRLEIKLDLAF